jgi:hypothetical protein
MAVIFEMGPPSFPEPYRTFFQAANKRTRRVKALKHALVSESFPLVAPGWA